MLVGMWWGFDGQIEGCEVILPSVNSTSMNEKVT
jgi:hypothetical protein